MSARQILKSIEKLPARELAKLQRTLAAMRAGKPPAQRRKAPVLEKRKSSGASQPVEWPDLNARSKAIFGDRVLPNPVLEEREESDR